MMKTRLSLLELGLVVGTRAVLAAGVGLLLADRWRRQQRHRIGWTLVAVGALTTLPLARRVLAGIDEPSRDARLPPARDDAPSAHACERSSQAYFAVAAARPFFRSSSGLPPQSPLMASVNFWP